MSPRLLTFMVAFAAFLGPFTQTVYAPILPELGGALRTTPFLINLSISIFTLVLAFMQIIYGPLVDRSGRKRTLLAGLAIYIVASLGCFLADRIETLLAFRALQAVGIAAGAATLGEPVETALVGVFDITKVGSQAWTVGAKIYWDDTNKRCTTVATDNTLIGVAVEAVASGASDTIGRVRLNAAF